ncbi:hypothetical protein [Enterococcus timonensis]|uniref:hypothetical protein n=1 Tax=Enterococcus timonensis TaxID=1852364 RepID=UPI0008D917AA|nr:hypothetical protein [Enterococcus timonensis]
MKKLSLVILAASVALLTACNSTEITPESNNEMSSDVVNDPNSNQPEQSSSIDQEPITQSNQTLRQNTDDKISLLPEVWTFDELLVTEIEAEWEDSNHLELEISWQNLTTANQMFANLAEMTVQQNGKSLALIETDDDFSDSVAVQAIEDFELTFQLDNQNDPVEITVTPKAGDAQTIKIELAQ